MVKAKKMQKCAKITEKTSRSDIIRENVFLSNNLIQSKGTKTMFSFCDKLKLTWTLV